MDIYNEAIRRQVDYNKIKNQVVRKNLPEGDLDIAVIVPVRGRTEFNRILTHHILDARDAFSKRVTLTFVEHSSHPQHLNICSDEVSYIWIPALDNPFNKCLAHNVGALMIPQAKYYNFHDVDTMVLPSYFEKIYENLLCRPYDAMQTFTGRRLLMCSEVTTREIFNGVSKIWELKPGFGGVASAPPGASGGSMLVKNETFYQVGGFDPEFFTEYSIEDQFFFDKLSEVTSIGFADNPPIEQYHLWHPPSYNRETKKQDWDAIESFHDMSPDEKIGFVQKKSELLRRYLS